MGVATSAPAAGFDLAGVRAPEPVPDNVQRRDTWSTPRKFFRGLDSWAGPLTLDVAALPGSAKCQAFLTPEDDAFAVDWNPPRAPCLLCVDGVLEGGFLKCSHA